LSLKIACGNIVGFDHELAPEQIMSPCAKTMNHRGDLLLLDRVLPLDIIKLLTLKGNWMSLLH